MQLQIKDNPINSDSITLIQYSQQLIGVIIWLPEASREKNHTKICNAKEQIPFRLFKNSIRTYDEPFFIFPLNKPPSLNKICFDEAKYWQNYQPT